MLRRKVKIPLIISGVTLPIAAITAVVAYSVTKKDKFEVQYFESGPALPSLNYVIAGKTALSPIFGFFMEGLTRAGDPPQIKPLLNKINANGYTNFVPYKPGGHELSNGVFKKPSNALKVLHFQKEDFRKKNSVNHKTGDSLFLPLEDTPSNLVDIAGKFYGSAMADIIETNIANGSEDFRARINPDAKWSNGNKITASQFVDTLKYMLDIKNAAPAAQLVYETIGLKGARKIIQNQKDKGWTIDKAWSFAEANNQVPARVDGTDNRWIHYFLNEGKSFGSIIPYLGGAQFMPINKKFVEAHGGILKYGQTSNRVLSNGPFQISSLDLDYLITFSKNKYYYKKDAVLLDHPAYKVAPSKAIEMQLFRDGKLSSMGISNELLASIYSDPKLVPLVKHGATSPQTSGLIFSKYDADKNPSSPLANKNFRKAIQYAINRNKYASYLNVTGSAPANTLFTARSKTNTVDEFGKAYYYYIKDQNYAENDPITGKTINIGFENYDHETKYNSFFSLNHNIDFQDNLYNEMLAKHFLEQYIKETKNHHPSFTLTIQAVDENKFLAIKSVINDVFKGQVLVKSNLVAGQIFTEKIQNGEFEAMFKSIGTTIDDPWTIYSQFLIEDGYDNFGKPYIITAEDKAKGQSEKRSLEVTSRYWTVPGFEVDKYLDTLSLKDKTRLGITQNDINAAKEATIHIEPTKPDVAPLYKYGIATQYSHIRSENINYNGQNTKNLIAPYINISGKTIKGKLFTSKVEFFTWMAKIESIVRDSGWFIPLLSSQSSFFVERRGLRNAGNSQGLPYGYRYIYPIDNNKLIEQIEKNILKKYGVSIVLERI